jgi:hypothetical protein
MWTLFYRRAPCGGPGGWDLAKITIDESTHRLRTVARRSPVPRVAASVDLH